VLGYSPDRSLAMYADGRKQEDRPGCEPWTVFVCTRPLGHDGECSPIGLACWREAAPVAPTMSIERQQ
jgi:hypothetical protein